MLALFSYLVGSDGVMELASFDSVPAMGNTAAPAMSTATGWSKDNVLILEFELSGIPYLSHIEPELPFHVPVSVSM